MLIFLPGLICDARTFAPQLAAFSDSRAMDSYGPAENPADTLQDMARITLDQAPERFDLFGHSMGGRIALEIYRMAPERVRRLALSSTGVHPVRPGEPEKRAALKQVGHDQGFEALVDQWLPPMVADANRVKPEIYEPMRQMCLEQGQARFDAHINALVTRPECESLLPTISCPTLVITGEQDGWAPPVQHEAFAGQIANSQLVIVPGAGHMLPLEAPGEVNTAIARWLDMPADD